VPELPDIDVYVEKLRERIEGRSLDTIRVSKPFLVRSFDPPLGEADGRRVVLLRRLGKRIVIGLEPDLWLVLHLMVAGRLHWREDKVSIRGKHQLAAFDFESGTLLLTEAGSKKRASLYLVRGEEALSGHDPGGLEVLDCTFEEFAERLTADNRTLKKALTNPRAFSGIGNAYSDEILHAAHLSPVKWTRRLDGEEQRRLFDAVVATLKGWRSRLLDDAADGFPEKVTAFRKEMAVHGKFGEPCPVCGTSVARIRYKSNETNYCPSCQTGGKLLADRSLSRLLRDDWPDGV
jgi:formamidopyrimidine-DNA glycosylase